MVTTTHITQLEEENKVMRNTVEELMKQVEELVKRVVKLEGTPASCTPTEKAKEEDDEEEEETEEEKAKKEELLRNYHEKKSKKPALIAKSNIILDVKPWDDGTDMVEVVRLVRTIEMDGL